MVARNKHKLLIPTIFFIAVFLAFPMVEVMSQESATSSQQQSQSTQKEAPAVNIRSPKIEFAPAPSTPEPPRGATSKEKTSSDKAPRIAIDSPSYDAGEVEEGQEIVHSFIVKNTGEAQLNIQNVSPG
jgi:cytoskeletal protein RodZ